MPAPRREPLPEDEFAALVLDIAGRLDGLTFFQITTLLRTVERVCSESAHFTRDAPAFARDVERYSAVFPKGEQKVQ